MPVGKKTKKIYALSGCSTCQRILKDIKAADKGFEIQDIKTVQISPEEVDEMKRMAGSYGALFSKRAIKFRELGLHEKALGENDYRALILEEYTFLKRPVAWVGKKIFVGSEKKTVEELKAALA